MSDIKTIREWFETKLPDGYRERAIANTRENDLRLERYSFSSALSRAFCWTDSREGHDFWHQVCEYYAGDVWNLPPLPESKDAARVAASLADDPEAEGQVREAVKKPNNPTVLLGKIEDACQHHADLRFLTKHEMADLAKQLGEEYGEALHAEFLKRLAKFEEKEDQS